MESFKTPLPPKPKLAPIAPVVDPLKEEGTGPSWSGQGHGLMLPPPVKAKAPPAPDAAAATPDVAPSPVPDPAMPKVDLKYQVPIWSPKKAVHPWKVEVLKSGQVIGDQEINSKGFFLVGRLPICDVELEHPTISRQHAIIQHRSNGNLYVYDLGSTHGTFVNKNRIKPNVYVQLKNNYQLRFGESTRVFVVQGGPEDQEPVPEQLSAAEQAHQAALQQLKSGGGEEEDDEEDTPKVEVPDGQDVFTGNLSEFKQFMKKQRGKAQTKNKKPKKDAKKLLAQLPELSKRVHGMVDDSDSDEDEEAAAPEAAEELPEDLELATRVTAAEELYDSGDDNDEFYDRTATKGVKTAKKAESESESSDDDDEEKESNPEIAAAKRRKKLLKKQKKEKAAAAKAQTVETLQKRVQDIETQKENLLFAIDELKTQANQAAQEEDSLDSFMKGVSATLHSDKIAKLQKQMEELNRQQEEARQLINLARPALERIPAKPAASSAGAKPFAIPATPKQLAATATPAAPATTVAVQPPVATTAAVAPATEQPAKAPRGGSLTNYIGLFETSHGEADNKRPADDGETEVHTIDPTQLEKGGVDAASAAPDKKKAKKDNKDDEAEAFQEWAPPTNQSGDGRTYLNDLYGY